MTKLPLFCPPPSGNLPLQQNYFTKSGKPLPDTQNLPKLISKCMEKAQRNSWRNPLVIWKIHSNRSLKISWGEGGRLNLVVQSVFSPFFQGGHGLLRFSYGSWTEWFELFWVFSSYGSYEDSLRKVSSTTSVQETLVTEVRFRFRFRFLRTVLTDTVLRFRFNVPGKNSSGGSYLRFLERKQRVANPVSPYSIEKRSEPQICPKFVQAIVLGSSQGDWNLSKICQNLSENCIFQIWPVFDKFQSPDWSPQKQSLGHIFDKFGVRGIFQRRKGETGFANKGWFCKRAVLAIVPLPRSLGVREYQKS